jgi:hypothetical protein
MTRSYVVLTAAFATVALAASSSAQETRKVVSSTTSMAEAFAGVPARTEAADTVTLPGGVSLIGLAGRPGLSGKLRREPNLCQGAFVGLAQFGKSLRLRCRVDQLEFACIGFLDVALGRGAVQLQPGQAIVGQEDHASSST